MTREEAIKILEQRFDSSCRNNLFQNVEKLDYEDALWMAISALRSVSREQELEAENKGLKERIVNWRKYMAPTREQVEKVWRGEWIIGEPDGLGVPIHCNRCGWGSNHADQKKWMEYQGHIFCGRCGAPMSDEAVEMVMERMDELQNEIG